MAKILKRRTGGNGRLSRKRANFNVREGVGILTSKLEKYIDDNFDTSNEMIQSKKKRYLELSALFNKLGKAVKADGETVRIINGAQEYTKVHPAIAEMSKINTQMLNIERDFYAMQKTKPVKADDPPVKDWLT